MSKVSMAAVKQQLPQVYTLLVGVIREQDMNEHEMEDECNARGITTQDLKEAEAAIKKGGWDETQLSIYAFGGPGGAMEEALGVPSDIPAVNKIFHKLYVG